ncbi:MAG: hypothetical protein M5U34_40420 [Chloroflexi bacterium]|nr:hypothetical protein [Chloroflexota bacterium]
MMALWWRPGARCAAAIKRTAQNRGRLVLPVGSSKRKQQLVLITRRSQYEFEEEKKGSVAFVPLVGQAGWQSE